MDPTISNPGVNSDIADLSSVQYIGATGVSVHVRGPLVDANGNAIGAGGGVTSVNGQTGPVTGAQAVAGADVVVNSVTSSGQGKFGSVLGSYVYGTSGILANGSLMLGANVQTTGQGDIALTRVSAGNLRLDGNASANGNLALGNLTASGPIKPGGYTISTLPSASSYSGYVTTVSNPSNGKRGDVLSNGTNWLYPDNSIAA